MHIVDGEKADEQLGRPDLLTMYIIINHAYIMTRLSKDKTRKRKDHGGVW